MAYGAVIVAGGAGTRLGGVDKASIDMAGMTLLERAVDAVREAHTVVVVGPARSLQQQHRALLSARENPPGGGPAAALSAGLARVDAELVVALAVDMPMIDAAAVRLLVETVSASSTYDGAWYVDPSGRQQPLAAAYRVAALRRAIQALGDVTGAPLRALTQHLTMVDVAADPVLTQDCDSWADVAQLRRILESDQ